MSIPPYAPAIRDAIARGDLREMKSLLSQAQQLQRAQGDLPAAMARLEKAIGKLSKKPTQRRS
jgi:phage shock protein A